MRTLPIAIFATLVFGCSNPEPVQQDQCSDQQREQWAATPFPWDNYDTTDVTKLADGCNLTTITHYFYLPEDDGSGDGGGSIFDLQCQYAECDGPLDKRDEYTDPMDIRVSFDRNGKRQLTLSNGAVLVPITN